eukprot:3490962-Rhodomonas_salina.1
MACAAHRRRIPGSCAPAGAAYCWGLAVPGSTIAPRQYHTGIYHTLHSTIRSTSVPHRASCQYHTPQAQYHSTRPRPVPRPTLGQ